MAVIKLVTNGDNSVQFKAVSLSHVIAIVFGLLSIIGAQQTWMWAAATERRLIVDSLRTETAQVVQEHQSEETRWHSQADERMDRLEEELKIVKQQVYFNTGKLEMLERQRR